MALLATGGWSVFHRRARHGPRPFALGFTEIVVGGIIPPLVIIGSWIALGASPGKLLLGLRIVDEPTSGRPSAWQCIGRYVMALVGILCAGIGYFWIAIDPRHQGWHDKIVRTLVVRRGPSGVMGPAGRPVTRRVVGLALLLPALLAIGPAGAQPAPPGGHWRLQLPDKPWALLIDLPGFVLDEQWPGRNGTRRMIRVHDPETRVTVSAFLERNPELASKEQCRDLYRAKLQKSPVAYSDVTMPARGSMALVRATVAEMRGQPIRQQNSHAHLFRDGVCMEIHLSKVLYGPDDERLFDAVLRTVPRQRRAC